MLRIMIDCHKTPLVATLLTIVLFAPYIVYYAGFLFFLSSQDPVQIAVEQENGDIVTL